MKKHIQVDVTGYDSKDIIAFEAKCIPYEQSGAVLAAAIAGHRDILVWDIVGHDDEDMEALAECGQVTDTGDGHNRLQSQQTTEQTI